MASLLAYMQLQHRPISTPVTYTCTHNSLTLSSLLGPLCNFFLQNREGTEVKSINEVGSAQHLETLTIALHFLDGWPGPHSGWSLSWTHADGQFSNDSQAT